MKQLSRKTFRAIAVCAYPTLSALRNIQVQTTATNPWPLKRLNSKLHVEYHLKSNTLIKTLSLSSLVNDFVACGVKVLIKINEKWSRLMMQQTRKEIVNH